jgi:hypothetical protein
MTGREDIAALLDTDAAFTCTRQPRLVRMLKRACVVRQDRAAKMVDENGIIRGWGASEPPFNIEACRDCPEGRRIRAELDAVTEQKPIISKEDVMEKPTKKVCTRCGQDKPLDDFHLTKAGYLGRKSICKDCSSEKARKYWERKKAMRQKTAAAPAKSAAAAEGEKLTGVKAGKSIASDSRSSTPGGWRESAFVTIDFKGHEDLMDELAKIAKAEFRDPGQQMLKILSDSLGAE